MEKMDIKFLTSPANMRWYSGFRGEGVVCIEEDDIVIFTDSRYVEAAKKESPGSKVIQYKKNIWDFIFDYYEEKFGHEEFAAKKVGFEDQHMRVSSFNKIMDNLIDRGLGTKLIAMKEEADKPRQIKNEEEIKYIKEAEHIGDIAFEKIVEYLKDAKKNNKKITEKQVAAHLEFYMKDAGGDGLSFETIAASGVNSSMPHAIPTDKVIEEGDFITMDYGCTVNGYHSDMTRTVVYGSANEEQKKIYGIVLKAQEAVIKAIKPGMTGFDVDKISRDIIANEGYGKNFGHSLGHSVGLEIHEKPVFSPGESSDIEPGNVITVEPGIYLEGKFGVRIEDVVVITEDGCIDITNSDKSLIEIQ